jgi:spore germination protein KA
MEPNTSEPKNIYLTVEENLAYLKNIFGEGINLVESRYEILENHLPVGLVFIDTISDKELIMRHVLNPLLQSNCSIYQNADGILQYIKTRIISATEIKEITEMSQVLANIMNGDTVLFVEQANSALMIGTRKVEKRSVESPENESTVLGSQESFTDDIKINCSLIIKRLPVPNLKFEEFTVGTLSCTKIKLIWLDGIANNEVINLARSRIQGIDTDNVDGIGVLGELIEDNPLSIFPKYRQTERPDVATRNLTHGRFAIICSNSPFAFIAPIPFWDNFKTMDDYQEKPISSGYLRIVRYISFTFSILISALYLSFVTYNQAIVPPNLALNIAQGREGVPFPSVLELLLLTFFITIIREAGLRMPGSVGYFVGTLAAVVIGQAIVTAGYVSASLIIIVAVSTISSFAISTTTMLYPSRILNYIFIILAGCFGMFGVVCGLAFLLWYLSSLESFGMPYLYPLIPYDKNGISDVFFRARYSVIKTRMKFLSPHNRVRTGDKGIK